MEFRGREIRVEPCKARGIERRRTREVDIFIQRRNGEIKTERSAPEAERTERYEEKESSDAQLKPCLAFCGHRNGGGEV